jgi:hypothetical protein
MSPFQLRSCTAALLVLLTGCHSNPACDTDAEYLRAVDRPRLQLPGNLAASERMAPLVIPPVPVDPARLDPAPSCLDEPPLFFARKGAVADSAEEAVKAWAAAWSERRTQAVMQMYSPSFQAPGVAGSAEFLDQRRDQVTTGATPAAGLEDVEVTAQGADRRTVTFVQRFDRERVRKELVLVREGGNWRIISERTFDAL